MPALPPLTVRLKKKHDARIRQGYPWVMKSDIIEDSSLVISEPGDLCTIITQVSEPIAIGYYNHRSMIAARVLSTSIKNPFDKALVQERLRTALFKRKKYLPEPFYRWVHSEGDYLPGLVIDRFGDTLVIQISTAGMEHLLPWVIEAVEALAAPQNIVLRNDIPAREKEGLPSEVRVIKGSVSGPVLVTEHNTQYFADVIHGQKTGWFYDQRENRKYLAEFCVGKSMLDMFCHSGGFGVAAAQAGASAVLMVDSSERALALATQNAEHNGVADRCVTHKGKAFQTLEAFAKQGRSFDVISLDPPAFAKTRKDKENGVKGYERLGLLAAPLISVGGVMMLTSCSHHASRKEVERALKNGLQQGGRKVELLSIRGAAPDHPAHPMLAENDYLKSVTFRVL